jgi:1-acyl-sn-glycerol-3-phosphate acyltransferase
VALPEDLTFAVGAGARPPGTEREREPGLERLAPLFQTVRRYHQHQVVGMEHVPAVGAALLVHNHSLSTYDNLLLGAAIYLSMGRLVHGLGDRLMFRIPLVAGFMRRIGFVEATMPAARRILEDGHLVGLTPGGMREALKPSTRRYEVLWDDRKGFARLSMLARVPIILAANPRGDEIYTVLPSRLTDLAYRHLKLPLPIAYGRAFTPLPRPVALTHVLGAPIAPPIVDQGDPRFERELDDYHRLLISRMAALMNEALARTSHAHDQGDTHG